MNYRQVWRLYTRDTSSLAAWGPEFKLKVPTGLVGSASEEESISSMCQAAACCWKPLATSMTRPSPHFFLPLLKALAPVSGLVTFFYKDSCHWVEDPL